MPVILIVAFMVIGVGYKLIEIQFIEGPELREKAAKTTLQYRNIAPARGNIYAMDGALLATTMPEYRVHMDVGTVSDELFFDQVDELAYGLSKVFKDRNPGDYERYLRSNRNHRYLLIRRKASHYELIQLKKLPIFNRGKYKGGLVYEQLNSRQMPLGKIAERTIGYYRNGIKVGLEGAFSPDLSGNPGKALAQKISRGQWKPLIDRNNVDPRDGCDLITTLDVRIQDVAHTALLRALEYHQADHGSVIVMDVKTGGIRAISNLGRTEKGTYFEDYNYAIGESTEPGSTFKLPALIAALEDGRVDTAKIVDTKGGMHKFYQYEMYDSRRGGYGEISLGRAFELSSNIGLARVIHEAYKDDPERFINRLHKMNLDVPTGVEIMGEPNPKIPHPDDQDWSGISLPWMATGYGVQMTPLQTLSFYNAIANDGVMMSPHLVSEMVSEGRLLKNVEPKVVNPAVCSKQVLTQVQDLLKGVVEHGTATNLKHPLVSMAGKTGTCVLNYWRTGETKEYQASFAGYFPAENPIYSCIVVVYKPKKEFGYYGSDVAAPVFKEIALKTMALVPQAPERLAVNPNSHGALAALPQEMDVLARNLNLQNPHQPSSQSLVLAEYQDSSLSEPTAFSGNTLLPNLYGVSAMDALYFLENQGIKVEIEGHGKVVRQSVRSGTPLNQIKYIRLKLAI